ncbi:MAG: CocE/NonD family hydrolase [Thiobacillus sp.]|nr:CocE/NonD family hydrolase [Thiobacillus sp.]MDP2977671.1 CocE/NonD family hydrolase [Thiobacillus sp.]
MTAASISRSGPVALALAVALLVALAGCAPVRHYEAVRVLQDFAAGTADSRLKRTTPAPLRQTFAYTVAGRAHRADLYLPAALDGCAAWRPAPAGDAPARCPRAALVAVPGAVPQGKDDPRMVAFATTLARAGFAVMVPDLTGYRQLRIRPSDAREIADAFAWISRQPELAPDGNAGMFAFSYSVGPAVLAALEDDIREQVRFVVGLGGYHDLPRAMRFFTTGWFEHAGSWAYITPDDTGRMVLAYSSLDYLADAAADRAVFDRMVAQRMDDPEADLAPLAAALSDEARAVYELALNADSARFAELFAGLPRAMREDIARLDLARHDLAPLQARLILVHGLNDNLIPYTESLALAAAVPAGQARVFLIRRVLGHVDLGISDLFTWRFWREDLPDLWRLWRVIDLLLAERADDA